MNCDDVFDVLSDYFDEETARDVCARIEVHLRDCPDCRLFVDTLRETITLYRSQADEPVPSDVHKRLFEKLELGDIVTVIPFPKKT